VNSGFINGFSVNGAAYPNWVIRAVVVAAAVASFTVEQTRTTFASAYGDAVVSVHLTQTHTIQARASGTASAIVNVAPTLKYAGASHAQATAFGAGAVRRDVFASAGGDATCTGEALTAQAIGEASASSASSVVLANAHVVFPGRALTPCVATGTGAGKVTRYPRVLANYGEVVFTRGEASVKRSGTSFYGHDGYVLGATARATGTVPQDRIKIIATLGSFDFCDSTATSRAFVRHPGRALGTGITTAQSVVATHIYKPRITAQASATADITGTRNVLPTAYGAATATVYAPKGLVNHAGAGVGTAQASTSASGLRMALGNVSASALASTARAIEYGIQHRTTVAGTGAATASAAGIYRGWGRVATAAGAASFPVVHGTQYRGDVSVTMATGSVVRITPTHFQRALAMGSGVALVGRAYGLANSEIKAPDDRYMLPSAEDRGMTVYAEERTMVVTA